VEPTEPAPAATVLRSVPSQLPRHWRAGSIAVGVGPRTVPDVVYHGAIVVVLVWGLTVTVRARPDDAARRT
jgi:hypothetical protein